MMWATPQKRCFVYNIMGEAYDIAGGIVVVHSNCAPHGLVVDRDAYHSTLQGGATDSTFKANWLSRVQSGKVLFLWAHDANGATANPTHCTAPRTAHPPAPPTPQPPSPPHCTTPRTAPRTALHHALHPPPSPPAPHGCQGDLGNPEPPISTGAL
jgi:hypothetical protein